MLNHQIMRQILVIVSIFIFIQLGAVEKSQSLNFEVNVFRFGTKYQNDDTFPFSFYYKNISDKTVIINNIHTTCGCVNIENYTKELKPGQEGEINVLIMPSAQIGKFAENILVFVETDSMPYLLKVEGQVIAGRRDQEFNYQIAGVYMPSKQVNFGYINKGTSRKLILPLKNENDYPVKLQLTEVPQHIDVFVKPLVIKPGSHGVLDINFHSSVIQDWDFVYDPLNFEIVNLNNMEVSKGKISISANIREDFSKMTAEDSINAPVVNFDQVSYNFGSAPINDTLQHNFIISNTGKSDLIIRKIKASCGCTAVHPDKNILKPGESTNIQTQFLTAGYKGTVKKGITIITNDPVNYKQYLWIEGIVRN